MINIIPNRITRTDNPLFFPTILFFSNEWFLLQKRKEERIKKGAIREVNSSIWLKPARLLTCSEIITKKQPGVFQKTIFW